MSRGIDSEQSRQVMQSVNAAGDLPGVEMEQDVADEGGAIGYGQDSPMGAPMVPPIVSAPVPPPAPRYPAPSGYSNNAAPDVYVSAPAARL